MRQHGESQFNVEGKIGGDSLLSPRGLQYSEALPALVTNNIGNAQLTVRLVFLGSRMPFTVYCRCGLQH
jgi:6-phosphofructo-2-kinase/fructose-2,6-biphosphatase 2